ncbi:MAG: VOC family protein [Pseudomonadota bacterium]
MTANKNPASNFVWTDLSSYDVGASATFYQTVFGWTCHDMGRSLPAPDDRFGMDQVAYHLATKGDRTVAGIFDMTPFFQKIKMPPFWMSYLTVRDIHAVVAEAKATDGATVDVPPCPFGDGTMALIRDPLGAGFTCYEGPDINSKGDGTRSGQMIWNELFTEDIVAVEPFYSRVLGFNLVRDADADSQRVRVLNANGEEIAGIQAAPASVRSEKVYWLPLFSVDRLAKSGPIVTQAGGQIISKNEGADGYATAVCYDNTGAAFGLAEIGGKEGNTRPWYRWLF